MKKLGLKTTVAAGGGKKIVEMAAKKISEGSVIAYPTESSYALGADATNARAVKKIFAFKGREKSRPLPIIVADLKMAKKYLVLDVGAEKLCKQFMPGPLTLVVEKRKIPEGVVKELSQSGVAFRIPGNKIAREICEKSGRPITSTSANDSGKPPVFSSKQLEKKYSKKIGLIADAGELPKKPPSTIVDLRGATPVLLREGPVPFHKVLRALKKTS